MIGLQTHKVGSLSIIAFAILLGMWICLISTHPVRAAETKGVVQKFLSSQIVTLKDLPKNRQARRIARPGTIYKLTFNVSMKSFRMDGKDLLVRTGKGGRYHLVGFLAAAMSKRPPSFRTRQGKNLSANYAIRSAAVEKKLAAKKMLEQRSASKARPPKVVAAKPATVKKKSNQVSKNTAVTARSSSGSGASSSLDSDHITTAAGPAGGGELFGAIPVFSWLLDRLDVIPGVQAQDKPPSVTGADPILTQLIAQLLIKREQDILSTSQEYETYTRQNYAQLEQRVRAGVGQRSDLLLAKNDNLSAILDMKSAEFRKILAVDAHQDRFGERLENADYPKWKTAPPTTLAQLSSRIGDDKILRALARRNFRQRDFSLQALNLIDQMTDITAQLLSQYQAQYNLGQRTASEFFGVQKMAIEIKIRRIRRQNDLMQTEASLQSIAGALSMDYVLHPGWQ